MGDAASGVCPETDSVAGDAMGNDSGAEVSSSISAALSFNIFSSPDFAIDNFLGFLILSSGMSWSSCGGNVFEIGSGEARADSSYSLDTETDDLSNEPEYLWPTGGRLPVHSAEESVIMSDGDELRGDGDGDGDGSCRTTWTAE